jgi:hypothetical protein
MSSFTSRADGKTVLGKTQKGRKGRAVKVLTREGDDLQSVRGHDVQHKRVHNVVAAKHRSEAGTYERKVVEVRHSFLEKLPTLPLKKWGLQSVRASGTKLVMDDAQGDSCRSVLPRT